MRRPNVSAVAVTSCAVRVVTLREERDLLTITTNTGNRREVAERGERRDNGDRARVAGARALGAVLIG